MDAEGIVVDEEKMPKDKVASLTYDGMVDPINSHLLRSFQNLHTLNLDMGNVRQDWTPLFPSINPRPLLHLHISHNLFHLSHLLIIPERFYNLQTLSIETSSLEYPFFLALPQLLHLRDLSLDLHIYDDHLSLPLDGQSKVHSLRSFKIMQASAECAQRGPVAGETGHQYQSSGEGFLPAKGWAAPRWSADDRRRLEGFIELAEAAGVNVGTHLQRAMEIEDERTDECVLATEYSETADGRRRFREEVTEEMIRFHRRLRLQYAA